MATDASKEITAHALDWVVRNVITPDSLIQLAVLPLQKHPPDSHTDHRHPQTTQFFSRKFLPVFLL